MNKTLPRFARNLRRPNAGELTRPLPPILVGEIDDESQPLVEHRNAAARYVERPKLCRSRSSCGATAHYWPPRLDTPLLFAAPEGGPLNLDNFRRREWALAVEAAGVPTPATPYDICDTFASNALAAGVPYSSWRA